MSLKKILFGQPGNLRELISALRKAEPSKRKVALYKDFSYGRINISAKVKSQKVFFPIYKTSKNSPYKSRQEELDVRTKEYEARLKQEDGFQVVCYW